MVRYVLTAAALKCFSSGPWMRALYRKLGNLAGGRRRGGGAMPSYYMERIKRMLLLQREHNLVRNGDRIIELGTGWLHWEALTIRLFYDVQAVVFDVWDNRQLSGLKNYVAQLNPMLKDGLGLSAGEIARAQSLVQAIARVNSFEELYRLLGFEYVVNASGSLAEFPRDSFQLVVSGGVLEHVQREAVPELFKETVRIVKPGGWVLHSIDIQDHLSYYDGAVSKKFYLTFSDRTWKYLFENKVQYFNRLQRGEWLDIFRSVALELVDEGGWNVSVDKLKLAERFAHMDRRDLECGGLRVLLRKPA